MKISNQFVWVVVLLLYTVHESSAQKKISVAKSGVWSDSINVDVSTGNSENVSRIPLTIKVWGNGDPSPGISFDNGIGIIDTMPLYYQDAMDPDVAIISDGANHYAVVAYYSSMCSAFIAEFFGWNGKSITQIGEPTILLEKEPNHSIVDVYPTMKGDFEIVWDLDPKDLSVGKRVLGGIDPSTGKPKVDPNVYKMNYRMIINYE